ncbi:RhoGAP-domain-containing protein [Alternaria alternata]|jgi:hypothetical protein|nr:RhoGAP-domain-containing protein [Alternaria alternata]
MAAPPTIPPMESTDSFNPDLNNASSPTQDGAQHSPIEDATPASPEQRTAPHDAQTQQRVHDILHSDVGVATLLNRLKASIASARVSDGLIDSTALGCANTPGRTSPASSSAEEP